VGTCAGGVCLPVTIPTVRCALLDEALACPGPFMSTPLTQQGFEGPDQDQCACGCPAQQSCPSVTISPDNGCMGAAVDVAPGTCTQVNKEHSFVAKPDGHCDVSSAPASNVQAKKKMICCLP
jgi:hypothetical protein